MPPEKISLAKRVPKPPKPKEARDMKDAQSLFTMMQVLSVPQRQRFGVLRRKWTAKPGIREKIEKEAGTWLVRYYKGRKRVAEARFSPQHLEFNEL